MMTPAPRFDRAMERYLATMYSADRMTARSEPKTHGETAQATALTEVRTGSLVSTKS
jgi:hypothetical protein